MCIEVCCKSVSKLPGVHSHKKLQNPSQILVRPYPSLKEGVEFDTRKVWTGILSRLKIVLHGFEVETKLKIEQMHRQFDSFNDFSEEQKEEIIEEEISRRNKKVDPLGIFDKEKDAGTSSYAFLYSFKWKDAHKLSDPDLNNSEG